MSLIACGYFRQLVPASILPAPNPLGVNNVSSEDESENESSGSSQSVVDSGEENESQNRERLPNPLAIDSSSAKLPPPALGGSFTSAVPGSVFLNPFQKAEQAKQSVLEKHVKMTNYVEEEETKEKRKKRAKDKRKLCHRFIKGNCKYGHKCRFSHDLGQKPQDEASDTCSSTDKHANYGNRSWLEVDRDSSLNDDDSYMTEAKRKKRVGVGDHLVPPKKAMKVLEQQRASERPWTVQNST